METMQERAARLRRRMAEIDASIEREPFNPARGYALGRERYATEAELLGIEISQKPERKHNG